MDESTKELEKYWDEFSQEYAEIQNESLVNIGQELREFLLVEKTTTCERFFRFGRRDGEIYSTFFRFY